MRLQPTRDNCRGDKRMRIASYFSTRRAHARRLRRFSNNVSAPRIISGGELRLNRVHTVQPRNPAPTFVLNGYNSGNEDTSSRIVNRQRMLRLANARKTFPSTLPHSCLSNILRELHTFLFILFCVCFFKYISKKKFYYNIYYNCTLFSIYSVLCVCVFLNIFQRRNFIITFIIIAHFFLFILFCVCVFLNIFQRRNFIITFIIIAHFLLFILFCACFKYISKKKFQKESRSTLLVLLPLLILFNVLHEYNCIFSFYFLFIFLKYLPKWFQRRNFRKCPVRFCSLCFTDIYLIFPTNVITFPIF